MFRSTSYSRSLASVSFPGTGENKLRRFFFVPEFFRIEASFSFLSRFSGFRRKTSEAEIPRRRCADGLSEHRRRRRRRRRRRCRHRWRCRRSTLSSFDVWQRRVVSPTLDSIDSTIFFPTYLFTRFPLVRDFLASHFRTDWLSGLDLGNLNYWPPCWLLPT